MPDKQATSPLATTFVSRDEAKQLSGAHSFTTFYTWIEHGSFPAPVRLGPNRVAWVRAELEQWIADRIAAPRTLGPKAKASQSA